MERRALGTGDLRVSTLSLGAMTFGGGFSRDTRVDEALAVELVDRALDAGVNLIDTADTYGATAGGSEAILAGVLRRRRDDVLVATKVGFGDLGAGALTPANVIASCEASLARLGIDHIDLFYLHRADRSVPLDDTVGALEELVRRGLVREIGASNFRAWEVARSVGRQRALGRPSFGAVTVSYSLVGRDVEHEILPCCRSEGLGVLAYSPLAGGQLAGWHDTPGAAGRRRFHALPPVGADVLARARAALDAVAVVRGTSMAQVALAWLLAQPGVTSAVIGPSRIGQLEDNLAALALDLDADELAALDAATAPEPIYPASLDRAWGFAEPA